MQKRKRLVVEVVGRGHGRCGINRPYLTSSSTDHSPSPTTSAQSDTICPICQTNQKKDWVACDSCDTWYHIECVNILPPGTISDVDLFCPSCEV